MDDSKIKSLGTTFDTSEPSLQDLLREVESGAIQLPDFQRPWVWEDRRIRALLASVSLSYPIGAVMLMQVGKETRFAPKLVEGVEHANPVTPERLILDGQQRLTSMFMSLMSKNAVRTRRETSKKDVILRWYYLDMKAALAEGVDHEDRVAAIIAVPENRLIQSDFDRKVVVDVTTRQNECAQHLFPLNLMFDDVAADQWFEAYQEQHGYSKETSQFLNTFRREVRDAFRLYRVPVIGLLNGTRKEAVCQVFENVNTGGVSLTVFELVTATFAADNFQLRVDWETRFKKGTSDRKLEHIDNHSLLHGVDGEAFLQSVALYSTYCRFLEGRGAVGAKRKDILRLTVQEYQRHADAVHRGFLEAKRLLLRERVLSQRELPYQSQLVPLAAILAAVGAKADGDAAKAKLAQWFWCGVFGELYGGGSEARFAHDMVQVPAWIDGGEVPRSVQDASFAPIRLLTLQSRQSAAYKGMMAPLMALGSLDLKTGDEIHISTHMHDEIDIHHLFPKAHCEKQGYPKSHWNSIINKAPIVAATNRSIGGRSPSSYLATIEKELKPARVDEILRSHAIDPAPFRADDFHGFVRQRAGSLLDLIEHRMGKQVSGRDSEEAIKAFGGAV